jgi:tRNA (adenine37-N6)-methyltransferase
MSTNYNFNVIGTVTSPYQEKFAIPRQPGLVSAAKGQILLQGAANNAELVRGLAQFSHLWLLFVFHGNENPNTTEQAWKPLVRPPRLGGNEKIGVLASRSTFRPNPIGMSVVKLDAVESIDQQTRLHISALDLLNGTPIIDIKPYLPYSDAIIDAQAGFAQQAPTKSLSVCFSTAALANLISLSKNYPELETLIVQVLTQDPRPAYKQAKLDNKVYGMTLYDLNIQWRMTSLITVEVINITTLN